MKLYIRIVNGEIFEHPIFEDNFMQAYPDIDINNLPPEFAVFERVPRPELNVYEVYEGVTYAFKEDSYVVTDVHEVRQMTDEEKTELQNKTKDQWESDVGFDSWVFNEELCRFDPPVPYPEDGNYYWDEESISWQTMPSS